MALRMLWVSDEVPDAGRGGGSIRQHHLLKRTAAFAEVDLVLVGQLTDGELASLLHGVTCLPRPQDPLAAWGSGALGTARRRLHNLATTLPGRPPSEVALNCRVVQALRQHVGNASGYDVVQVEHEHLAGVLPRHRNGRWAITLHNLLSVRCRQRAAVTDKPRVRRLWEADARRAAAWERRIVNGYDLTFAVSAEDAEALGGRTEVVPNGVDLEGFPATPVPPAHSMIFSASFNYEPNIDGAVWLCEEILPRVRSEVPDATLLLVGRQPHERVRRLAALPGVDAHFDVPSVFPLLAAARVALVPLRQGSGTRLKALEAMAAGRPLAGTPVGLEGLGLVDGESALMSDSAEGVARAAVRLLLDDGTATRVATSARSLAERHFGWDSLAERYLDSVLRRRQAGMPASPAPPR
ncbi:MAG TPA: glycosyltransferase family 4 protein [Acidimicrobiales bacterium]|nr:glycosyltransferase family 4 protein [Acidimicrobiales bacterium]